MVPLSEFDKITFKRPNFRTFNAPLTNILGFDSEAYKSGRAFMFCTSSGDIIAPENLIETLFNRYASSNFVCWNLKYESGAILKLLPRTVLNTLQKKYRASYTLNDQTYTITYLPHKLLKFKENKFGGRVIKFWDISPFYGRVKLETASSEYLKAHKRDMDPNLFTEAYVEANFDTIAEYCVQDCKLTCQLALLWIKTFEQTGIPVNSLYSEASVSFEYFSRKTEIVSPFEYWEHRKDLLRFAFESYEGGKFEITARGKFTGYEYDISSAYPAEIRNLADIRGAEIIRSKKYVKDATYAFLRVRIKFEDPDTHLPCGVFRKLRLYPMGDYHITITKQEYDYIKKELPKVTLQIIDAVWIIISKFSYPYRDIIDELYELKTVWKKKDKLRSKNYKIIMNGFYGKMAQCLPDHEGGYHAGRGWNPIYASVITANTRISVTRLQNLLGPDCLAVHTDSVISTTPIPDRFLGEGLGQFELVEKGKGVLVACGIYEINGQCALKGFRKNSITSILKENPGKKKITLSLLHVESWLQAMAQNHDTDKINLFTDVEKTLTLNCDTKRMWPNEVYSDDLLNSLQYSFPLIEYQKTLPNYWKKDF